MIGHIIKIIWNERKSNILIFLEYIAVFCVLWFCCDYLYYLASRYFESHGYDIKHTYIINLDKNNDITENQDDRAANAILMKERIEKYPGVEAVSFSTNAIPYGYSTSTKRLIINKDSTNYNIEVREVTPEYFEVFKLQIDKGRIFSNEEVTQNKKVYIISPDRYGYFKDDKNSGFPVEEVKELYDEYNNESFTVIGVTEKQKRTIFEPFKSTVFELLSKSSLNCQNDIVIRVNAASDQGFTDRFKKDMKERLTIGPYSFGAISSLKDRMSMVISYTADDNIKSVLAITAFLIINIFLGIIGTFWSRTESRKAEIGLRIALGSSKNNVRWMMFLETIILLSLASIIGAYICINLAQSDLIEALGIPTASYEEAGFGTGHYFVNYVITYIFLAIIGGFAVWYPSRAATNMSPADALRED